MTKHHILYTIGLNSICSDGKHIIMLDYDNIDINIIKDEIEHCIDKFLLSSFYIIKSYNGFNAFCLDKLELYELKKLFIYYFKYVDKNFIRIGLIKQNFTLRIGIDKLHAFTCKSNHIYREKSLAHKRALQYYYDIKIIDHKNYDSNLYVQICEYENIKYGISKND